MVGHEAAPNQPGSTCPHESANRGYDLSKALELSPTEVELHLELLRTSGYLRHEYRFDGNVFRLTKQGRAYLVENGLLLGTGPPKPLQS